MENREFTVGEKIIYCTHGICIIEDIRSMSLSPALPEQPYYVLRECKRGSLIYVPVAGGASRMRDIYDKETIDRIICGIRGRKMDWNSDRKARTTLFKAIIVEGLNEDLLLMIRCIKLRKKEIVDLNKKLSDSDDDLLQTAEQIVNEELSFVLGIDEREVGDYIRGIAEEKDA